MGRQAAGAAKVRGIFAAGLGSFLSVLVLSLSGCNGFFVRPTTTTTPTTPTPSNTGDYAYVANSSAGSTSLSEYNVGSGSLLPIGTIDLGYAPVALSVAPLNSFLYAASPPLSANPGIFLYSIGASGALTAVNVNASGSNLLATDTVAAMTISPDGNWLFTVNSNGLTMNEYSVNTATGELKFNASIGLQGTNLQGTDCALGPGTPASQTCSVAVSPSGAYVVVALRTAGDAVFSYSSASGIMGGNGSTIPSGFSANNPTADFSVVVDANNFAYIARTNSLGVYNLVSGNGSTATPPSFASGTVPRGITLSKTGSYLFTANEGTGSISSFGVGGSGSLNAVTGSPFAGPKNVSALGMDKTGTYMVAVGYDASAGVWLYSVSGTGVLTKVAVAASGTNTGLPALVAMTH